MSEPRKVSLAVDDLTRRFGKVRAVDDVTFHFQGPGIIGLAGPNGSGKTTLIRCLLGLLKPTQGTVRVDGEPPGRWHARTGLKLGYMPQNVATYQELTVRENIAFFARVHRVPRHERKHAVDRALEFVQLTDRAGDRVTKLSGGMQRRVSLACTLVHRPDLLILDEPTVGVDPELRNEFWEEFRKLRQRGALLILSTHYLGEVARCDVVLFLRKGRILAGDKPANLLKRTKTKDFDDAFLALLKQGAKKP
jgi:ABC-2 type transport system ATP-binding protein